MCLGSPVTQISTLVGSSTRLSSSFCLCCLWHLVRHLWSLHLSSIPHHTDFHLIGMSPNQFLHSVCICVRDSPITQTSTPVGGGDVNHLEGRWWDVTQTSALVGMSTWAASSFCLCCVWQAVRCLWSLHMSGIACHTDLYPGRNVYLTSWFILSVLILTGGEISHRPPLW